MNTISSVVRCIVDKVEDFDLETKFRFLRRYPRRRLLLIGCIVIFVLYIFTSGGSGDSPSSTLQQCVNDRLRHWSGKFDDLDVGIDHSSVSFIGNGYVGVDSNGELRLSPNGSRVLDFATGFFPFVNSEVKSSRGMADSTITDFKNGLLQKIKCFLVDNECACIMTSYTAHRTRKNVLIEDVKIINPTKSSITLDISRPISKGWSENKSVGDILVHSKTFTTSSGSLHASVMCSNAPREVTVMQKREETYRFTCILEQSEGPASLDSSAALTANLTMSIIKTFANTKEITGTVLDQEHSDAWMRINAVSFHLSHSKAPAVLNGDRINITRYLLLSNVRAPTLEVDVDTNTKQLMSLLGKRSERCYTGHSTLLYPSRLWQDWDKPEQLIKMADLWLLTLEKRGCANVVKTGAEGVAQALVLSLTACSFHEGHLEMEMAASELHREMSFAGIPVGNGDATVAVRVVIESDNRPYLEVSSSSVLYACDGGCLDAPVTLAKTYTRMPIKVTKPQTSILYVASSRKHLEQLKSAIHVSEVGAAPAHEENVLSLHRHGEEGMPTSFWVFLGIILIAFHAFLAKLLWSEWRKGDMTPYNPYLRNRYSYVRSH